MSQDGNKSFMPPKNVNPYQVSFGSTQAPSPHSVGPKEYGGIGRLVYIGGLIGLNIVLGLMGVGVVFLLGPESLAAVIVLVRIGGFVLSLALMAQRLINIGTNPWWVLGMLVPILNLLIGVRALICPEGYADHKTLDTPAKIIVGILLAFIGVILCFGLYVLLFG